MSEKDGGPAFPSLYVQFGMTTRADQIFAAFKKFHAEHPEVWTMFKGYTYQVIEAGAAFYGAAAVFERMRWHYRIERNSALKLNNNFRAYYARMFEAVYPEHDGIFRSRVRKSEFLPPAADDLQEFVAPLATGEGSMLSELRKLGERT